MIWSIYEFSVWCGSLFRLLSNRVEIGKTNDRLKRKRRRRRKGNNKPESQTDENSWIRSTKNVWIAKPSNADKSENRKAICQNWRRVQLSHLMFFLFLLFSLSNSRSFGLLYFVDCFVFGIIFKSIRYIAKTHLHRFIRLHRLHQREANKPASQSVSQSICVVASGVQRKRFQWRC